MFIRESWDMGSNIDIINIYNVKKKQTIKHGYGAYGGAALSALFKVMIRQPFFIVMRDATVQLCCVLYKAWPTDPIGGSQEPRLHGTIAILGNVSSAQLLFRVHSIFWKKDCGYVGCLTSYDPRFGQ